MSKFTDEDLDDIILVAGEIYPRTFANAGEHCYHLAQELKSARAEIERQRALIKRAKKLLGTELIYGDAYREQWLKDVERGG